MEVEKGAARSEPAANDEDAGGRWASRGCEEGRDGRGHEQGQGRPGVRGSSGAREQQGWDATMAVTGREDGGDGAAAEAWERT